VMFDVVNSHVHAACLSFKWRQNGCFW
jgi:hypothetical protein